VGAPLGNLVRLVYRGLAKALETGTFLHRGPLKYHGGGGLSLHGGPVRGTWRGGFFARSPEGYERKALGMGISLHGGSVGQPGVGSSTGDFERWMKGALVLERLSLKTVRGGGLGGEVLHWGPWTIC